VDIEEKIDFPLGILFSSTSSLSGALSMAVSSKYRSRFSTPTWFYIQKCKLLSITFLWCVCSIQHNEFVFDPHVFVYVVQLLQRI